MEYTRAASRGITIFFYQKAVRVLFNLRNASKKMRLKKNVFVKQWRGSCERSGAGGANSDEIKK